MENRIPLILQNINQELKCSQLPVSLMGGQAGIALFNVLYNKHFPISNSSTSIDEFIQKLAEDSIENKAFNLSSGRAGTNWFFSYLYKFDLIDKVDYEAVCLDDNVLMDQALKYLDDGVYDFLHGSVGIAYYFLYKKTIPSETFFKAFFDKLNLLKNKEQSMFLHYDFMKNTPVSGLVNLGLSHGIASILKLCLECIKRNLCVTEAKLMAQEIIEYLLKNINPEGSVSFFPSTVGSPVEQTFSRLAWCYGDLGIAYILFQASVLLSDSELKRFAIHVLKCTTNRQKESETAVNDCSLCHGSIGVAHIYNALWYQTQDQSFKSAADNWIKKSIELAPYDGVSENHVFFNSIDNTYQKDYGLLSGSAGIGLAYISYLTGDFSWDYCLMLN